LSRSRNHHTIIAPYKGEIDLLVGRKLMPKFIIEREIEGAGNLSIDELQAVSQKSGSVLSEM